MMIFNKLKSNTREWISLLGFFVREGFGIAQKQRRKIKNLMKEEPKEQIHVVWFCLDANTYREGEIDQNWLKKISNNIPILAVITKFLTEEENEFQSNLRSWECFRSVVACLAEIKCTKIGNIEAFGLENLQSARH